MHRRAFTLVEVLVSLAIFAIASVVLAAAYLNVIGGYSSLTQRQQQEEDWKFARTRILSEPDRLKIEAGGRLPLPGGRNLAWRAKVEPTEVADLFRVMITCEAPATEAGREPWHREQSVLLLRQGWSEPGEREKLRTELQRNLERGRKP